MKGIIQSHMVQKDELAQMIQINHRYSTLSYLNLNKNVQRAHLYRLALAETMTAKEDLQEPDQRS
jgi:hypothetical protein